MAPILKAGEAQALIDAIVGDLKAKGPDQRPESLIQVFVALVPRLNPDDGGALGGKIVGAFAGCCDRTSVVKAVVALAPRLNVEDASALTRQLLNAFRPTGFFLYPYDDLTPAFVALAPRLKPEGAVLLFKQIVESLKRATTLSEIGNLANAGTALAPVLSNEDVHSSLSRRRETFRRLAGLRNYLRPLHSN
jgi:hypothetical protein